MTMTSMRILFLLLTIATARSWITGGPKNRAASLLGSQALQAEHIETAGTEAIPFHPEEAAASFPPPELGSPPQHQQLPQQLPPLETLGVEASFRPPVLEETLPPPQPEVVSVWQELWNRFHMVEIPEVSNKCQIFEARHKCLTTGEPVGPIAIVKVSKLHELMRREADAYKYFSNNDLFVKVYEYHLPRTEDDVSVLIMERGHFDIRNYLREYGPLQGNLLRNVSKKAAEVLAYMHAKDRVWAEMKSQNFVITDEKRIKAIDFESAIPVGHRNILYTSHYAPPEFAIEDLQGRNIPMEYSFDIWTYGMFLYEIATGALYFHDKFDQEDREGIFGYLANATELDLSALKPFDPAFQDLVRKCLTFDPAHRPNIQEVLYHPYFFAQQ